MIPPHRRRHCCSADRWSPPARAFTVRAAIAELVLPQVLENTARYWLLLCETLAAKLNGLLVAPGMLVNPPPLLACHCNVGAGKPLPAARE